MIIVETSKHNKQNKLFDEQFYRDQNSYAVPFKKVQVIQQALDLISLETSQKQTQKQMQCALNPKCFTQIKNNIFSILRNAIHMNFSLDQIRETIQMLVQQQKIFQSYNQYIRQMDKLYGDTIEPNEVYLDDSQNYSRIYGNTDITDEKQNKNTFQIQISSFDDSQLFCSAQHLKSEILQSPKYYNSGWKSPKNSQNDRGTDCTHHETPQQQIQQQTNKEQKMSARYLPTPSILLQQNITKIAKQQQKNDYEKYRVANKSKQIKILNKSSSKNKSIEQKMYLDSIKMIKIQQKMRSTSRKNSNKTLASNKVIQKKSKQQGKDSNYEDIQNNQKNMSSIAYKKNSIIKNRQDKIIQNSKSKKQGTKLCNIQTNPQNTTIQTNSQKVVIANFFKTANKFK